MLIYILYSYLSILRRWSGDSGRLRRYIGPYSADRLIHRVRSNYRRTSVRYRSFSISGHPPLRAVSVFPARFPPLSFFGPFSIEEQSTREFPEEALPPGVAGVWTDERRLSIRKSGRSFWVSERRAVRPWGSRSPVDGGGRCVGAQTTVVSLTSRPIRSMSIDTSSPSERVNDSGGTSAVPVRSTTVSGRRLCRPR